MVGTKDRNAAGFAGDERGTIAIIFALTAFILVCVVGLAIDYGRTTTVKNKLQRAADAAVMANLSTLGKKDSELRAGVEARLHANLPKELQKIPFDLAVANDGAEMTLTMQTKVPTSLMSIAGFNHLPVNIEAKASISKQARRRRPAAAEALRGALEQSGDDSDGPGDLGDALPGIDLEGLRNGDSRAAEELISELRRQLEEAQSSGALDGLELPGGIELPGNIFRRR